MKNNLPRILVSLIIVCSTFLLFYKLSELMVFIGDQGWYYLSARDLILTGTIPLVGITSSHTWLHQGALWTYMLAPVLLLFRFNPVGGAYLTAGIGIVTVWFVYKIGHQLFSQRVGILAALLYATSPLIISHARMAYHTSPIPLLTLLLMYVVYLWVNGKYTIFPFIPLLFALLYNYELATFTLVPIVGLLFMYGLWKKKSWVLQLRNRKIVLQSLVGFLIPMIPMIVYDFGHGFPQTLKFVVWVFYKIAVTLRLYPPLHPNASGETYATMLPFAASLIQKLLFLLHGGIAIFLLLIAACYLVGKTYRAIRVKEKKVSVWIITSQFFFIPALGYIAAKTNSEGYVLFFFPTIIYMLALVIDRMITSKVFKYVGFLVLIIIVCSNTLLLLSRNFLLGKYGNGPSLAQREKIVDTIITDMAGKPYKLKGEGPWSQYESYTMNYQYLLWLRGNEPVKSSSKVTFVVRDELHQVQLKRIPPN